MRIVNRAHLPWFIFVVVATGFAFWLYAGNFHPQALPAGLRLPGSLVQSPSTHRSVGGTPLGLIFGTIALSIFIFAALLGIRKKLVLWRIGTVQRWLRAHIWLTLLTIPLVLLHSGFRLGGPMTTLLVALYVIVMVSGIYGLVLQHYLPGAMMERLPAESVYEQIPHIRAQLLAAAKKMQESFKPAPAATPAAAKGDDTGAPAPSAEKAVTVGSTPMSSTSGDLSTPTARAKTVVGSSITAETVTTPEKKEATPVAGTGGPASGLTNPASAKSEAEPVKTEPGSATPATMAPPANAAAKSEPRLIQPSAAPPVKTQPAAAPPAKPASVAGTGSSGPTAPPGSTIPAAAPAAPKPAAPVKAAPPTDDESEIALRDFLDRQIIPYLAAKRGDRMKLGKGRFAEDTFRFVKLRVTEAYRDRVEEIQAWCDERRMLDLQIKMQHWLHGWLFVHAPISFLLLMLTFWHAFVTLFYY